ncbi:hypothetical protein FUA26_01815 [Seonamhaeicola algicola]|uniref:Uncharacterized protein n=1 Tax=Seonamhaeicola algicola TaxID=1719036 RepID=A0A5C7AZ97_9FLAO|nr:hypothetical protein [Seonamhaeicola algicola]TXE13841.1 hypothetical protein FUA26_01815 [Seonamhaeicola algicola]
MAFNNDLNSLIKGIYLPSILYIPKSLAFYLDDNFRKEIQDAGVFDHLVVLSTEGILTTFNNDFPEIILLNKENILDNNILQLLKFRDQFSDTTFNFIKTEYLKHANNYQKSYTSLLENIDTETTCVKDTQKVWFELQMDAITKHIKKLKEVLNFENNINYKDNLSPSISELNILKEKRYNSLLENVLIPEKKKPKAKPYKISNEDADIFLLQSVFNVDLNAK